MTQQVTSITYRIDQFEGPLDLLLSLISKNKININDIPISIICDQYMEYIDEVQVMDMELSSEFLVMASQLMLIKSRMLLPKLSENEEDDPRAALALALIEYQRAKEASKFFTDMFSEFGGRFEKDTDEITVDKTYVAEHDISLLVSALMKAYAERDESRVKELSGSENHMNVIMSSRAVSVTGKIFSLMRLLRQRGKITASEYFSSAEDKPSLISMFMAVLELLRAQRLKMEAAADEPDGTIPMNTGKSIIFELDMTRKTNANNKNQEKNTDSETDSESDTIYEI